MRHPFHRDRDPDPMKMFKKNKTMITGLLSVGLVLFFVTSVLISGQATRLTQTTQSQAAGPGVVSYRDWTCNSINLNAALVPNMYGNSYSVAIVDIATGRYINDSSIVNSVGTDIPRTTVTFNKPLANGVTVRAQLLNYTNSTAYGFTEVGLPYSFTPSCPSTPPPGTGIPDIRGSVTFNAPTCAGDMIKASGITGALTDVYIARAFDTNGTVRDSSNYVNSDGKNPATVVISLFSFNPPLTHGHTYKIKLFNFDPTVSLAAYEVRGPGGEEQSITYTANCPGTPAPGTLPPSTPTPTACNNVDVALSLDSSGSMSGSKIASLTKATNSFVAKMKNTAATNNASIYGAVGIFNNSSSILTSLRPVAGLKTNYTFTASGGTAMGQGIQAADKELDRVSYSKRAILLMSDGRPNLTFSGDTDPRMKLGPNDPARYAYAEDYAAKIAYEKFQNQGTGIYTVGFGKSHNAAYLQYLASITNGRYYAASTETDLINAFNDIASRVCSVNPSPITSSEYNSLLGKN